MTDQNVRPDTDRDGARLFGRGLSFPPRIGQEGRMVMSSGAENVRECIRVILLTDPGERLMLHDFGAGLRRFLAQPNEPSTHRLIEEAIRQSLGRWEPRVDVDDVIVERLADDPAGAVATIRYSLVATQVQEELRLRLSLGGRS